MFFCVKNGEITGVSQPEPTAALTLGFLEAGEAEKLGEIAKDYGFNPSTVRVCREKLSYFRGSIEVYDTYTFGTVKCVKRQEERPEALAFYVTERLFLVVSLQDAAGRIHQAFQTVTGRVFPTAITKEIVIFSFFEALCQGDGKRLEDMEFAHSARENSMLQDDPEDDFVEFYMRERRRLVEWRNFYEQLIDMGEALFENENRIFKEEHLRYFKIFTHKAQRYERNVRALYEQLRELRAAYLAMLDLRLDGVMKLFAVLSAVFLPLTLITSWYGMNFQFMPELASPFGYPAVIVLSLAVAAGLVLLFRHKRWL